jgi:hypothetical protein
VLRVSEGFDEQAWRQHIATSPLQGADWLAAMSSRLPGEVHTICYGSELAFTGAVVRSPDAYESYNPHTILWRQEPVFGPGKGDSRREWLAARAPGPEATLPALVLVAPGYLGDPVGPSQGDARVVHALLTDLLTWCREHGIASVSVLYTWRSTDVIGRVFAQLGGVSYPLTERWLIPVWWDSWDGYLAGLPARRAQEAGRELRRTAQAGYYPVRLPLARYFDDIIKARCRLLESHGQAADMAAECRRLDGLIRAFGDRVTSFAAVRDGGVAAVSVCVQHGRSMHVVYTGMAYRVPLIHFLATFYAIFQHVSMRDLDEIDYGIGHGTSKALRGCRPVPVFGHTIGTDQARNKLLKAAGEMLQAALAPLPRRR